MEAKSRAVVLYSGGLDSTTILYDAISKNYDVFPLSFAYDQRHSIELKVASLHCSNLGLKNKIIKIDNSLFKGSALTTDLEVPKNREITEEKNIIPITYVPIRNLILLSLAGAYAESNDIDEIFIGVNAIDYSGYPDCRPEFIEAFQKTLNLASRKGQLGSGFNIKAPLLSLTKKQIIEKGMKLNVPYELTWSCYDPKFKDEGVVVPCKKCDSCILRQAGFTQAGIKDPLEQIYLP